MRWSALRSGCMQNTHFSDKANSSTPTIVVLITGWLLYLFYNCETYKGNRLYFKQGIIQSWWRLSQSKILCGRLRRVCVLLKGFVLTGNYDNWMCQCLSYFMIHNKEIPQYCSLNSIDLSCQYYWESGFSTVVLLLPVSWTVECWLYLHRTLVETNITGGSSMWPILVHNLVAW